jgi:hypothetical protein
MELPEQAVEAEAEAEADYVTLVVQIVGAPELGLGLPEQSELSGELVAHFHRLSLAILRKLNF